MALVLAKPAAFLQGLDCNLRQLALFHLIGGLAVKTHDVLIKRDAPAICKLLQIGNAKIAIDSHFY